MSNNPQDPVEAFMTSNGFKYHVDVLNRFWEKGDFRNRDYIKVTDNAATFFYREAKRMELKARLDEAKTSRKQFVQSSTNTEFTYNNGARIAELEAQLQLMEEK